MAYLRVLRLAQYSVPTPKGKAVSTPEAARQFVDDLGQSPASLLVSQSCSVRANVSTAGGSAVLKSQLLRPGRGRGVFDSGLRGGVQRARNGQDAETLGAKMLGHKVRTEETIDEGLTVKRVYVSKAVPIVEEWHLTMTIDRETYSPVITIGKRGVATAREPADKRPTLVHRVHFQASEGITADVRGRIADYMKLPHEQRHQLEPILSGMYNIFIEKEATNLEISPLARLADGFLTCVGSNFIFDDAASKRQAELFALRDAEHEVPEEVEAEKYGLVYVRMDGDIGNVVNGAGLAMATNDAIGLYGGKSANFLDAGGQATKETMVQAFSIVLRDERVKTILVNVYGGKLFKNA